MDQYGQDQGFEARRTRGDHPAAGNINVSAVPKVFFRQLKWMVPAFLILTALSWWLTRDVKRQYIADGRILVQLGPEYVYNPATGSAANPLMITPDQVVLTEIGIIKNSAIMDQVINQMIASPENGGVGGERFAPKLYEKWVKAGKTEKTDRWNDIVKMVEKSYVVAPKPKSSIVDLVYKHPDGEVAVKTLDAMMTSYQNFRKNKFVIDQTGEVSKRRADTEAQLSEVEGRIQWLLNKNGISEFTTEEKGVQKRAETLRTELNTLNGRLAAAEGSLAAAEDQLRAVPPTINLYVDDRAQQRLAQAELEKRQLLAKYLPNSRPVRAKQAEINEIRAQIRANGGKPAGGRRVGPNPVYQGLVSQRNTFKSQADALREQQIVLERQLSAAINKVSRLRKLGPQYENLMREKATIEARLKGLQARETEALVNLKQQENSSENIKIITRPTMPRKGRNMKKILFALGVLGSAFTMAMLGLLRTFLDPSIYGPGPEARRRPRRRPEFAFDDEIPEPVTDTPSPAPAQPIIAPAAAAATAGAAASEPADFAQEHRGAHMGALETKGAGPVPYTGTSAAYETPVYADGRYGNASPALQPNPYLSEAQLATPAPIEPAPSPNPQFAAPESVFESESEPETVSTQTPELVSEHAPALVSEPTSEHAPEGAPEDAPEYAYERKPAVPIEPAPPAPQPVEFAGPDGTIPVLGKTPPQQD